MKKVTIAILTSSFLLVSCSSLLKYDFDKAFSRNKEFEQQVVIVAPEESSPASSTSDEVKAEPPAVVTPHTPPTRARNEALSKEEAAMLFYEQSKAAKAKSTTVKPKETAAPTKVATVNKTATKAVAKAEKSTEDKTTKPKKREPDIEDSEGFDNQRRPLVDPFRVGEVVTHDVSYLGAKAGVLRLEVKPFAMVNNRKSYNFFIDVKSTSFFSKVYAVDDQVQTYVDYEELVPWVFKLNIRDSGQVKEAQSFFNFKTLKANYWERRYTEKDGQEEKKLEWDILPYSQNAFSAVFYMRVFQWTVGKEHQFRVADDEKNINFTGRAIEKTKLKTEAGTFDAIKIKAEIVSRGNLAKATDFYLWVSDDDRKYILRIEVKLPIGSLVSEVSSIKAGK
ncbi:DUF3108 domain-containing protein [Pseudobdellovibrio exovorus]|uniref:DUF3108 domain-containing protein n=1 Tax=Pseudobdellovibrio exovorus JSS TaxID=1184267 RepID=M4VPT1_9BACT|nr:DUF3108 domain-containing protein [Pseudobdellovibrio exovorus]AGH95139.1 hypothetical protein A11Q_923 [Pseudobdellovibrio exovorus JSS]